MPEVVPQSHSLRGGTDGSNPSSSTGEAHEPRAPKVWDVRSFTNCYWADPSPSRSTRAVYCDRVVRPSERLAEAGRAPLKSLHNPLPRFNPVPIRHIDQAGDPADQRIFIAGKQVGGVGHLPRHLDDASTFCLGEILDHDTGEVE